MSRANVDTLIVLAMTVLAVGIDGIARLCLFAKNVVTGSDEPDRPRKRLERKPPKVTRSYGPLEHDTPSPAEESGW